MSNDRIRYISRCAYEGIEFPITRISTQWGHDSVKHSAYRRPGVENETTGKKPLVISVDVALINSFRGWGQNMFPGRFKQLIEKIEGSPKGVFTHPTRGFMDVHVDDVSEPMDAKSPLNGAYVTLQMTEDNATASLQLEDQQTDTTRTSTGDPGTAVQTKAAAVDTLLFPTLAALGLDGDALKTVAPAALEEASGSFSTLAATQIGYLESASRTFAEARSAIAVIRASVDAALALDVLTAIDGHDLRAALEALRAAVNAYEDDYLGNVRPSTYTVRSPMSIARIASVVYGDPAKASLIRAANEIPNGLFVPVGTELLILPDA